MPENSSGSVNRIATLVDRKTGVDMIGNVVYQGSFCIMLQLCSTKAIKMLMNTEVSSENVSCTILEPGPESRPCVYDVSASTIELFVLMFLAGKKLIKGSLPIKRVRIVGRSRPSYRHGRSVLSTRSGTPRDKLPIKHHNFYLRFPARPERSSSVFSFSPQQSGTEPLVYFLILEQSPEWAGRRSENRLRSPLNGPLSHSSKIGSPESQNHRRRQLVAPRTTTQGGVPTIPVDPNPNTPLTQTSLSR
ncbi:hypothetical protein PHJA_001064200 [Phtheirospermum japonicum]|uniref:Uncharacterized protein n=1 Tax=Phtheirospermum japonicum TaxID=374723 RepID=A0A830C1A7_9LAMI|nr:hypothetical protein PHJA_001064200 [Phtheirospermum japonicum]